MERERAAREMAEKGEFERIQAERKNLPMFPYRCARRREAGGVAAVMWNAGLAGGLAAAAATAAKRETELLNSSRPSVCN